MNGAWLNLGSSPMESWSAPTLPDSMLKCSWPTFTGRPRASESVDSILGRKAFTSITNGSAIATTIRSATTMPIILSAVFMGDLLTGNGVRPKWGKRTRQVYQNRPGRIAAEHEMDRAETLGLGPSFW